MARRNVSRGTRAPLRKMVWARQFASGAQASGVGVNIPGRVNLLDGFEAAYGANLIGATVVRIRGTAAAVITTGGNNDSFRIAIGVEPAAAAAPAIEDGPFGSPYKDWMAYESFINLDDPADLDEVSNRVIDVKSMRKIEEINEQLTLYAQGSALVPADTWNWAVDLSILLKLA